MWRRFSSLSLLWKIPLSTSVALTALFAVTGWIVQDHATRLATLTIDDEVRASFQAYESLWRTRAEKLAAISLVLSRMPDVRGAFSTRDRATIRDTAGEVWGRVGSDDAMFLVTDPQGVTIAALGRTGQRLAGDLPIVRAAARSFPRQASGFLALGGNLYQVTVTPVYVETASGPALLNVLVAGYLVDDAVARTLREETGGSQFIFTVNGQVAAASEPARAVSDSAAQTSKALVDLEGRTIGELRIYRSLDAARQHLARLRRDIVLIWAVSTLLGVVLTWLLARRILKPVAELDRAAGEIARGNYGLHLEAASGDELGRLATTFNGMCASLVRAQREMIRQERIATIGRLTTSLVHDLRNPLAAIFGGAEMLVDSELGPQQVKRLAGNIYKSSRRMQELLQDLLNVGREVNEQKEVCRLVDLVRSGLETQAEAMERHGIQLDVAVAEEMEVEVARSRVERVVANLAANAVEAMPAGGVIRVSAIAMEGSVVLRVEDNGPGVPREILDRLFQPFVTAGKKNGSGLGLALSRQTILDHGGDLWHESAPGPGARFRIRLPLARG